MIKIKNLFLFQKNLDNYQMDYQIPLMLKTVSNHLWSIANNRMDQFKSHNLKLSIGLIHNKNILEIKEEKINILMFLYNKIVNWYI
jgi:hypothetical protein